MPMYRVDDLLNCDCKEVEADDPATAANTAVALWNQEDDFLSHGDDHYVVVTGPNCDHKDFRVQYHCEPTYTATERTSEDAALWSGKLSMSPRRAHQ